MPRNKIYNEHNHRVAVSLRHDTITEIREMYPDEPTDHKRIKAMITDAKPIIIQRNAQKEVES